MAGTIATSGACLLKAGTNVNSDFTGTEAETHWVTLINMAESFVNAATRINYTDTYSTLNDDVKKILEDVVSSKAAMIAIQYDMSGYTSRIEAQTMLDVNADVVNKGISLLKDKKQTDFINAG